MKSAFQQGNADGLCGIYSIINLYSLIDGNDSEKWLSDTFQNILHACETFGWLKPQFLATGFEQYQLKAIVDLHIENWRMEYRTHYLEDINRIFDISFVRLANKIVSKGGHIFASTVGLDHWVLISGQSGVATAYDSDPSQESIRPLSESPRSFSRKWGFAMLPQALPIVEVDI